MSNKMFNNLLKKMDSNPNRYKPSNKPVNTPEHNKDDGQEYLMDLGKLLCVVTQTDSDDEWGSVTPIKKIYTGTWDKIYKKFLDDFDFNIKETDSNERKILLYTRILNKLDEYTKTNGTLYEEYDKNYKNSVSENNYYKMNPKLIFTLEIHGVSNIIMYVVPMSEVEDLDKNTTVGGRRRKTHKNKRK